MSSSSGGKDPPDKFSEHMELENCTGYSINNNNQKQRISLKRPASPVTGFNKVTVVTPNDKRINIDGNKLDKKSFLLSLASNRYKTDDVGPFVVFVESPDRNAGKIHPMKLGKIIFSSGFKHNNEIINMIATGRNRIKVEFKTKITANSFVDASCLHEHNLYAYIPSFFINKMGVIRNVDIDLEDQEILSVIQSPIKIKNVRRITKTISEDSTIKVSKLGTCILTFDAQKLPENVSIYGMRCRVDPYVPPIRQCRNCFRFNHLQDQCKSKSRCENCGLQHDHTNNCEGETKCSNCSGRHKSSDKTCPEYARITEEKRKKANASTLYSTITSNRFNLLENIEEFPDIETHLKSTKQNNTKSRTLRLTSYKKKPYERPGQPEPGRKDPSLLTYNKESSNSQTLRKTATQPEAAPDFGLQANSQLNPLIKEKFSYSINMLKNTLSDLNHETYIDPEDIIQTISKAYQTIIYELQQLNPQNKNYKPNLK